MFRPRYSGMGRDSPTRCSRSEERYIFPHTIDSTCERFPNLYKQAKHIFIGSTRPVPGASSGAAGRCQFVVIAIKYFEV
jgi:hypothetical protein